MDNTITSASPRSGDTVGVVFVTEPDAVQGVVDRARKAFADWGGLDPYERKPYLRRFTRTVLRNLDRVADMVVAETGKDRGDALIEATTALTLMHHYTRNAPKILRRRVGRSWPFVTTKGWTEYTPRGVAGVITPWNYPFYLPMLATFQALAAGCTVVLKPSEMAPLSGQLIGELATEAGLPTDVLQVIHGLGDTGAALVGSTTDVISFTGSTAIGKKIAAHAAETLKPVILELGGNDAMIVLDDANVKAAAKAAVTFGVFNAGQTCVGVERVYVVDEVYDRFVRAATKAIDAVAAGTGDARDIGPIIHPPQIEIVERHVADAVEKGATIVRGGRRVDMANGAIFYEPTLITDVDHTMVLMRDETFGPVVPVMRVPDGERALEMANDSNYGLHGSVWTRNKAKGARFASRMDTGTVAINDHLVNFILPSIEFGGIRDSGLNGQLGPDGLRSFCVHKGITSARIHPTTRLLGAWLPRRVGPRYWKALANVLFRR